MVCGQRARTFKGIGTRYPAAQALSKRALVIQGDFGTSLWTTSLLKVKGHCAAPVVAIEKASWSSFTFQEEFKVLGVGVVRTQAVFPGTSTSLFCCL